MQKRQLSDSVGFIYNLLRKKIQIISDATLRSEQWNVKPWRG